MSLAPEDNVALLRKQGRVTSDPSAATTMAGPDVDPLLTQLQCLQQTLGLSDVEMQSTMRVFSQDTQSQIRNLRSFVEAMKLSAHKFSHIERLWETRSLLCDPGVLGVSSSSTLLRQNLIQLHEAVEAWRSTLSQPLPVVVNGRMILFDLLEDSGIQSDIHAHLRSLTALSAVSSKGLALSQISPYSETQFRPKVKDLSVKRIAASMLPTCGHFPFSLSEEDVNDGGSSLQSNDRQMTAAIQRALTFLRSEHQRQIILCRNRLELARQGQYQPVVDIVYRSLGLFPLPEYLVSKEEATCTQLLREVSRMYSVSRRSELGIIEVPRAPKCLNVRSLLKGSFELPLPSYLLAIPDSRFPLDHQLVMVSACIHIKWRFVCWVTFGKERRKRRMSVSLHCSSTTTLMRSRFLCWYRYLLAIRQSASSPTQSRVRRKSLRRSSTILADAEPSRPASPHFHDGAQSHCAAYSMSCVEQRPPTASVEVQVGARTSTTLLIRNLSKSVKPR